VQPPPSACCARPLAHSWASIVATPPASEIHVATSNMKTLRRDSSPFSSVALASVPTDVTLQSALAVHAELLGSDLHYMTSS
jgi:hypothetical protein